MDKLQKYFKKNIEGYYYNSFNLLFMKLLFNVIKIFFPDGVYLGSAHKQFIYNMIHFFFR